LCECSPLSSALATQMMNVGANFDKPRFALVIAIMVVVAVASFAAASWKDLSATDGYWESLGVSLPLSDGETLNSSNCYDACTAIWGQYVNDARAAPRAAN
jgi:predicted lipoprotein with Yx(FWY)xxD motif